MSMHCIFIISHRPHVVIGGFCYTSRDVGWSGLVSVVWSYEWIVAKRCILSL